VASGSDNEKFNADFGTYTGDVKSTAPEMTFDKDGPVSTALGGQLDYTLSTTNNGSDPIGFPQFAAPVVFQDSIPVNTTYVGGSAETNNTPLPTGVGVNVLYSTDGGTTWDASEPADPTTVTDLQWWLDAPLPAGATATVTFRVDVPLTYPDEVVPNTGGVAFGPTDPILEDTVQTFIEGVNEVSGTVFKDDGAGTNIGNGIRDTGDAEEVGISGVAVNLYVDVNGDGTVDAGDLLWGSATTAADGSYSFANVADGLFIVEVVKDLTGINCDAAGDCDGWSLTTTQTQAVDLDSAKTDSGTVSVTDQNFGFSPALMVDKELVGSDPIYEGDSVSYTIDVTNLLVGEDGAKGGSGLYEVWAGGVRAGTDMGSPTNALGAPNSSYAYSGLLNSNNDLLVDTFSISDPGETIESVELILVLRTSPGAFVDDRVDLTFVSKGTSIVLPSFSGPAVPAGSFGTLSTDVTAIVADDWSVFSDPNTYVHVTGVQVGGYDGNPLYVDAVGFRITTRNNGTFGLNTSLAPVPLTDTYDPAKLQFVSTSIPPTSVDEGTGTISWDDIGPINAGVSKRVTLTFKALEPAGNSTETPITNTATVTNAFFANGDPANDDTDTVDVTLEPTGTVSGTIWSEGTGGTTGWVGATGYEAGDPRVPGVTANLWVCTDDKTGDILYPASDPTRACTAAANGGEWTLLDTAATDENGDYLFDGLRDGHYYVQIDPASFPGTVSQTGDPDDTTGQCTSSGGGQTCSDTWTDPGDDLSDVLTIASANDLSNGNFGYDVPPAIFGSLWEDHDGDGVRDAGDGPLAGWTVTLNGATVSTDVDGNYLFPNLTAGAAYTITVTTPSGETWTQTYETDGSIDNSTSVTPQGGEVSGSWDFGFTQTGTQTIIGNVYGDWNNTADLDAGDEGFSGATVRLYADTNGDGLIDPATDALVTETTTAADGSYSFADLPDGDYIVDVEESTLPGVFTQTEDPDSMVDGQGAISLTGTGATGVDFGYLPSGSGSLGDTVFIDANGDGTQLGGTETGIANITVELWADLDADGVFTLVRSATTDADGKYLFDNLPDGAYEVRVDAADADLPTDASGNTYTATTAATQPATLANGAADLDKDFGFGGLGAIGDTVFWDADGDGQQDWNELGIAVTLVTLTPPAGVDLGNGDGQPISTYTDSDGKFLFSNLPPGDYTVSVGAPATNYPQTADPDRDGLACADNTYPSMPACDHATTVTVNYGTFFTGADFGYQPSGVIGDFVWFDQSGDGVQDAGEPGIAGVSLNVTNGSETHSVVTDFDGFYSLSGLPDGDWTVTVNAGNFDPGNALENMVATFDADGTGTANTSTVTISGGSIHLDQDFGYRLNGPNTLSGTICIDDGSGDGVCTTPADETALEGTVVNLYKPDGTFMGSTTTDVDGNYSFANLPDDTYIVSIGTALPPLDSATLTTTDTDTPATSITTTAASVYQTVPVSGGTVSDVDFAFELSDQFDYGDLPAPYATLLAEDGPRHSLPATLNLYLGSSVDGETDGSPTPDADGDAGDDGVTFVNPQNWVEGADGGSVAVNVTGDGWLVGWIDFNNDGDFADAGEMIVSQAAGTGTGAYTFDIPAGTSLTTLYSRFRLFESQPPVPVLAYKGAYDNGEVEDYVITLVNGRIGDQIWLDADGDGVQDIGEPGISGVTVDLYEDTTGDGVGDTLIGTTVTDANGEYVFDKLPAGDYFVDVADVGLDGVAGTGDEQLTNLVTAPGSTDPLAVTLTENQDYKDADLGYVPVTGTAVIGDTVWNDVNGDGMQDPDEIGIEGVTIALVSDPGADGVYGTADDVVAATTTTNVDGSYLFTNVIPGEYVVVADVGPDLIPGTADDGLLTGTPTTGPQSEGNYISDPVTVIADGVETSVDFGFTNTGTYSVSDRVWYDADGDGNYDPDGADGIAGTADDELGLSGVTVNLYKDINGDGVIDSNDPIVATVTTDTDGTLLFSGVPDGDYLIGIGDIDGVLSDMSATTTGATDGSVAVTISGADVDNTASPSFGYNQPGTIGGTIYSDADGDGSNDSGEAGLAGVPVTLYDSGGNVVATTTTNADGSYSFEGVPAGTYTVVVNDDGTATGQPPSGFSPGSETGDPDGTGTPNVASVTLAAGESAPNTDFGYNNPGLDDITGTVFEDPDSDGTYEPNGTDGDSATTSDNETGIGGVTIELRDTNGNVIATTTANLDPAVDANGDGTIDATDIGYYEFTDVPDGNYTVAVTDAANVLDGYELTSGLDQLPVTADSTTAGNPDQRDFGYVDEEQTAAITSGVWIDGDGDGIRDPGEAPVGGVDIDLFDCGNDGICGNADDGPTHSATTDADGNVIYPDLPPGNYQLDVDETTLPGGGTDFAETGYAGINPNDPISLSEGETYNADFGYVPDSNTASLSGTVWSDADGNGLMELSEVGIGGVTVNLIDPNDGTTIIATTTTNPDGSYIFTGVAPGEYLVGYTEGDIPSGLDGSVPTNIGDVDGDGPPDIVHMLTGPMQVNAGEVMEDLDFGFTGESGTTPTGKVDGYVYYEPAPANGDMDGSDTGIESVTVNLVDSGGNVIATVETSDGFTDVDGDGTIDPAGYYTFDGVLPGIEYTVVVTDTNNATIGLNPTENPSGTTPPLNVTGGGTTRADFGYAGEQSLGNIGNLIWLDTDNDGIFNADFGDVGIAGVTVECWADIDGDKALAISGVDNLIRTVTTDTNGEYYCEGVPTGGYLVRVTDTAGALEGFATATVIGGTGAAGDSDNQNRMAILDGSGNPDQTLSGPVSMAYYMVTASDNLTGDFAVVGNAGVAGVVYNNTATLGDGDYTVGQDTLVEGVPVTLYKVEADGSLTPLRTVTTVNGIYAFTSVPVGVELRVIADPSGTAVNGYTEEENAGGATIGPLTSGDTSEADFGYFKPDPTLAVIGEFKAYADGGSVLVEWQTVSENGTLGFHLKRLDDATGKYFRVNRELLPGLLISPQGGTYRYVDEAAEIGGTYTYRLVEQEARGGRKQYGPFTVTVAGTAVEPQADSPEEFETVNVAGERFDRKAKRTLKREKRRAKSQALMSVADSLAVTAGDSLVTAPQAVDSGASPVGIKIAVSEQGLYRVSAEAVAQGLGISNAKARRWIKRGKFTLSNQGYPVAWRSVSRGNLMEFFAEGIDSQYTDRNIYQLKPGNGINMGKIRGTGPQPVEMTSGFQTQVHVEQEQWAVPGFFDTPDADYWVWDYMFPHVAGYQERSFDIETAGLLEGTPAQLTVNLQGGSSAAHRVEVRVNGAYVGAADAVGIVPFSVELEVPGGVLMEGTNTVTLTAISPASGSSAVYVDSFDVAYEQGYTAQNDQLIFSGSDHGVVTVDGFSAKPVVYDVSDPYAVKQVLAINVVQGQGGDYVVSLTPEAPETRYLAVADMAIAISNTTDLMVDFESDLDDTTHAVDYVVITPDVLAVQAQRLADYRQGRGLRTKVVLLQDIYDEFNFGLADPEAVRDFLAYAWHNWSEAPRYVVRCGEGTYDYKDIQGYGENLMPPKMVATPYGLFASENRLADVDGSNDGLPEMSVGILPAENVDELGAMIDKIIAYETSGGEPDNRVLMVADNPDGGGEFHATSDRVAQQIPAGYTKESIYLGDLSLADARGDLLDGFNSGALLVNYIGHAALDRLAGEGMLTNSDVAALNNGDKLPIVIGMTCSAARHEIPGMDAIGEQLATRAGGGAIAVWAPTGWSLNHLAETLNTAFFTAVFQNNEQVLGDAILSALETYSAQGLNPFMLDIYTIIGDPALQIR
jgi:uncharacterized repeat protein (TIGR01451 family)